MTANLAEIERKAGLMRTADTIEMESGGQSLEFGFWESVGMGTAGAAFSAWSGLANTGTALGESLGVIEDDTYHFDTKAQLNTMFGKRTAAFYSEHQTGIDILGLVAGSIIPGMAAIRGLRALQMKGVVWNPLQVATGLKNPDFIMSSPLLAKAKQEVLEMGVARPIMSEATQALYRAGAKQQLMENIAFEVGFVVSMNQHTTLNPDQLGYFEAMGDQTLHGLPFVGVGAALGTGIDILRAGGSIKRFVKADRARVNNIATSSLPALAGLLPGDKLVHLGNEAKEIEDLVPFVDAGDFSANKALDERRRMVRTGIMEAITEANAAGDVGREALEKLVNGTKGSDLQSLASTLAALREGGIRNITKGDLDSMTEFYSKTTAPVQMVEVVDNVEPYGTKTASADAVMANVQSIKKSLAKIYKTDLFTPDQLKSLNGLKVNIGALGGETTSTGAAARNTTRGTNIVHVTTDSSGTPQLYITKGIFVRTGKSEDYSFNATNVFRKNFGMREIARSEYDQMVYLHELGHWKSNTRRHMAGAGSYFSAASPDEAIIRGELLLGTYNQRGNFFLQTLRNDIERAHLAGEIDDASLSAFTAWEHTLLASKTDAERTKLLGAFADAVHKRDSVQVTMPDGSVFADATTTQWFGPHVALPNSAYFFRTVELFADAVAEISHPLTRERASRMMPNVAKILDKYGSVAKSWSDTKAFYNVRRNEMVSSALPGVAEATAATGGIQVTTQGTKQSIHIPMLKRTIEVDSEIWKRLRGEYANAVAKGKKQDYMEYDAQFAYYAGIDIPKTLTNDKTGEIVVNASNIALMERLATQESPILDSLIANGKVFVAFENNKRGQVANRKYVMDKVVQYKREYRDALLATDRYNEHEIARILNIEVDRAIGVNGTDGWTIMDKWDLRKPQLVSAHYEKITLADAEASVKSMVAVNQRAGILDMAREVVASTILGTVRQLFPKMELSEMAMLSPMDETAGMLKNLRPEFDSVRVRMAESGRLTENLNQQHVQEVANNYVGPSSIFNRRENGHLRHELAQTENLLHRSWYYLLRSPDMGAQRGAYYMVRKDALVLADDAGDELSGAELKAFLESSPDDMADFIAANLGQGEKFAPNAVKLSDEVGGFYSDFQKRNAEYISRDTLIAQSLGRSIVRDPNVLYAPPRDLKRYKHIAFVVPNAMTAGSDPRKFMIFAETEAELVAKRSVIRTNYGDSYKILERGEVADFKKYIGEYDEGLVFDELYFDASMSRKGVASELVPSTDLQVSGTLDRFQSWEVNKGISHIRSAVESVYADQVQYLRNMDRIEGAPDREMMFRKFSNQSNIYKDSLALILGKRATSGAIEDTWVRVNDYIGEKGSKIIDGAFGVFRDNVSTGVTEAQLLKFNTTLEQNGYKAPLLSVMETVLVSPDPQVSRALPSLVRTMNNLAGTLMLRMDFAHSIVTTISTPILALPVLMEAKRALSGSALGERLSAMTTVINPANGLPEPSAMKLLMKATKAYFTPEGKAFLEQLRQRGIVTDYLQQYNQVVDFSQLNGRHTMKQVNDKIDVMAKYGSKISGFKHAEEFSRFLVAWSAKEIGEVRGLRGNELMSVVGSSVDKVVGIYIGHQRPQLFQGVVGQAIGLYQTYFFNFVQNMTRHIGSGDKRAALAMGAMQSSVFGVQSWPGFTTLNQMIGETNKDNVDIYEAVGANDPKALGAYMMYGLGSHALITPIDFFSRGDLAIRNALVVPNPLNPMEIPAVGLIAKAVANTINVGAAISDNPENTLQALIHGMAHNGMNRPLQGLGTILQGNVTSKSGQVNYSNSNYVDYNMMGELNFAGAFARLLGTRPLDEAILTDAYYRKAAYQAGVRTQIEELGTNVQLAIRGGTVTGEQYAEFAQQYEEAGGDIQNFNAYIGRQFQQADKGAMLTFRDEMAKDSELSRAYRRMEAERSGTPPWQQ